MKDEYLIYNKYIINKMQQNSKSLIYFTIRETISCFIKKATNGTYIEEQDISQYILSEMINFNLAESMDKFSLDYNTLYTCFDILDTLGLISRKNDISCTQRFLTWTGFKNFKNKFQHLFAIIFPSSNGRDFHNTAPQNPLDRLHNHDKFRNSSFLDKFIQEFVVRLLTNDNYVVYKTELQGLKNEYLNKDCNIKELENRKRVYQILKYTLIYMGLISNFTLASSDLKTQNTGLQWSFPHIEVFTNYDEEEKVGDGG